MSESLTCIPRSAFTLMKFDTALLVASNLGGQGGRCVDTCYIKANQGGCCYPCNDTLRDASQPCAAPGDAMGSCGASCYDTGTCVHWYDLCME